MACLHFLLLGTLLLSAQAAQVNPIDQVISMLDDMTAKVTADGEAEEKAFAEFFEWCDDAAANTKNSIKTATAEKGELEALIGKSEADISAGAATVEQLAASISTSEADLAAATGIRNKEAADFSTVEAELVDGINTLDRATGIIEKEMAKNPALLQQRVDSGNIRSMLSALDTIISAAGVSSVDSRKLTALVQNRESADDEEMDREMSFGAPAAAGYKSQSGGIVDILEDMKEKAEAELGDARKAESAAKHNFNMLKQSLEDQLDADNKDMAGTKKASSTAAENKATAEGDLANTVKALADGNASLNTVSTDCMTSASDHEASKNSRAEELNAIATAKKIIAESTGGAADHVYFLQVASLSKVQTGADLANLEIVTMVKKLAKQQHSAALAQLASRISAAVRFGGANGDDVFAKVKGLISSMIEKLEKDAANEASHKAYCDEELKNTADKKAELTSDLDSLSAKIDKASAASAKLKSEVAALQSELAALAKTTAEMDKIRADENRAFTKAKADLEAGISGVQGALQVLRDYYGSASLIQQPAAPAGHSASGGAGGSIISMLEVCESDFTKSLAKEEMAEQEAQSSYDTMTQKNKMSTTMKNQDVKYKSAEAKSLDKAVNENSSDKAGVQTELDAVLEYAGKLNGMCVAEPETYAEKKARREAEISGLKDALNILESEAGFLQKPRHLRRIAAH